MDTWWLGLTWFIAHCRTARAESALAIERRKSSAAGDSGCVSATPAATRSSAALLASLPEPLRGPLPEPLPDLADQVELAPPPREPGIQITIEGEPEPANEKVFHDK